VRYEKAGRNVFIQTGKGPKNSGGGLFVFHEKREWKMGGVPPAGGLLEKRGGFLGVAQTIQGRVGGGQGVGAACEVVVESNGRG